MAYAATPAAPTSRPSTVSAAIWLLYLYAVLQVAAAVVWLSSLGGWQDAYTQAFRNSDAADAAKTIATVTVVVAAVISLFFGVVFVVLGLLDSKGKNWARIVTWVLGGVGVCCGGYGLISAAAGGSMNFSSGGSGSNMPTSAEIQSAMEQHLPSYFTPALTGLGILGLLALLGAVILLALPASNAFFRKRPVEPAWEPPPPFPPAA